MTIVVNGNEYTLIQTCGACPEQYDVVREGKQVGYLRLRHGSFRADCPDCMSETVLMTRDVKGDGIFESYERDFWLKEAITSIDKHLEQNPHLFEKGMEYDYNR